MLKNFNLFLFLTSVDQWLVPKLLNDIETIYGITFLFYVGFEVWLMLMLSLFYSTLWPRFASPEPFVKKSIAMLLLLANTFFCNPDRKLG